MKKTIRILMGLVIIYAVFDIVFTINMSSTYAVQSKEDYIWGTEATGFLDAWIGAEDHKIYNFSIDEKSHIFITLKTTDSRFAINVFDKNGNAVSDSKTNTLVKWNSAKTECTITHSCDLDSGMYYIEIYPTTYMVNNGRYAFIALAESVVSLSTPVITELESDSEGAFTIISTNVSDALIYEVQYSTDPSFATFDLLASPSESNVVTNLFYGTYYYVRTRAYTVYNDGNKTYSNWSRARSVLTKKATNIVTIYTDKKTIKNSVLVKNNQSFAVIADDVAYADLKFSLSTVPSAAKGYISIDKSNGTITVKKGLKKGKYVVKVTVSASETGSYNKATATKSIEIKVE